METQRTTRRYGFWHGVLSVVLILVFLAIMAAVLFPVFFRARRAASYSTRQKSMAWDSTVQRQAPSEAASVSWDTVQAASLPRMVISTGDLSLEVKSVKQTQERITKLASGAGGFITGSTMSGDTGSMTGAMTIRVPAKSYVDVLTKVSALGKVLSREEKGEDVTEEFVDLQSRLRNLKREEQALLGVLNKANRVTDILAVERELNRVRGEIEQATGRAKYLENQVALATINVSLTEPEPAVSNAIVWDLGQTASRSAHALGAVFRALVSVVAWLIIWIPLWALFGAIYYGAKRHMSRRRTP